MDIPLFGLALRLVRARTLCNILFQPHAVGRMSAESEDASAVRGVNV